MFFVGCASQKSMFKKAKKMNTIESYENYLEKYPNNQYSENVKSKLDTLEYQKFIKNGGFTIKGRLKALENYLLKYPNGKYLEQAQSDISEIKQIDHHVVISAVYEDERGLAKDGFEELAFKLEGVNLSSSLYFLFLDKLNYKKNDNFKSYISGVSNNYLNHIKLSIPEEYIWIILYIKKYSDYYFENKDIHVKIFTPGVISNFI